MDQIDDTLDLILSEIKAINQQLRETLIDVRSNAIIAELEKGIKNESA